MFVESEVLFKKNLYGVLLKALFRKNVSQGFWLCFYYIFYYRHFVEILENISSEVNLDVYMNEKIIKYINLKKEGAVLITNFGEVLNDVIKHNYSDIFKDVVNEFDFSKAANYLYIGNNRANWEAASEVGLVDYDNEKLEKTRDYLTNAHKKIVVFK